MKKKPYLIYSETESDENIIGNLELDAVKAIHGKNIISINHKKRFVLVKSDKMSKFDETISNYIYFIQKRLNQHYIDAKLTSLTPPKMIMKKGRRFIKIISSDANSGCEKSVHSFVEIDNGNVWKAASWKAPALNYVRANIYDYESLKNGIGFHGTR